MGRIERTSVFAAAIAVVFCVVLSIFDMGGWDPTRLLRVGEQAASREFVTADIEETTLVPGWGHDGQANYVLAAVLPDLSAAETHVDSVTYRARRIVYPALLAPVPTGMPLAVAMWVLNLAAVAVAAGFVAAEARRLNAHWLAGALVGATPAFLASALLGLGDALALAFGIAGLWVWRTDRSAAVAISLLTLAALTRETTLVIPAALFLTDRRGLRLSLLIPPAVVGAWIVALGLWIGDGDKSAAQFRAPFAGWFDPRTNSSEVVVVAVLVVGSLLTARRLWTIERAWSLVIAFEAVVLVCLDQAVLFHPLNLGRVAAWVLPFAVVAVTAQRDVAPDAVSRPQPSAPVPLPATAPGG